MLRKHFLHDFEFEDLVNLVTSPAFPFYVQQGVAHKEDDGMILTHMVITENKELVSPFIKTIATPLINAIKRFDPDYFATIRIKVNCYPKTFEPFKHGWHIDIANRKHKTVLLNLVKNNGYTDFKNTDLLHKNLDPNDAIIFDGNEEHRSVTQTDVNWRYNININYE
jgi:hypothetical protein